MARYVHTKTQPRLVVHSSIIHTNRIQFNMMCGSAGVDTIACESGCGETRNRIHLMLMKEGDMYD